MRKVSYTLREPLAFSSWLRKLVLKSCDRLTRGKQLQTVPVEETMDVPSSEKNVVEVLMEQEIKEEVLAAVHALPEHQQTVTTLFYISGYTQNEIADFLGSVDIW